jgi:hypothetical protein
MKTAYKKKKKIGISTMGTAGKWQSSEKKIMKEPEDFL